MCGGEVDFHKIILNSTSPTNIYLFKVTIETIEKGVKYF